MTESRTFQQKETFNYVDGTIKRSYALDTPIEVDQFTTACSQFTSSNDVAMSQKFSQDRYYIWMQHYCLTSAPTWSLRIGWNMAGHTRNWPISNPASKLAVIGCQSRSCSRFVETKAVRITQ